MPLDKQYGKQIFNIAKVLAVSAEYNDILPLGSLVHLQDEWLESEADFSKGMNPTTGEPKYFRPLGKLMPYYYVLDKLSDTMQDELLFLIPGSIVAAISHTYEDIKTAE